MIRALDAPVAEVAEALVSITSAVGLTTDEVLALLIAGLKVNDLLDYAEAMVSNRLN